MEYYIPSLLELIEGEIRWTSLTKMLNKRFAEQSERYNQGEKFECKVNLYSITASAAKGDPGNIQFLSFINNIIKSLTSLLNKQERRLISTNLANLLEYDEKFLHYLGELCVLNSLLSSGEYKLEQVEYKLKKNSKSIDFKIQNKKTNEPHLIEVVNIELRDDIVHDFVKIETFLFNKLNDKLLDTDKSGIVDYTIIPVIWGGIDNVNNVLKVKEFYEKTNFSMNRVQVPRVYMQLKSADITYNKFGSILNCLDINSNKI